MDTVYNKLVRDLIPLIIEKSGKKAVTRILDNEEYVVELKRKLSEEAGEYIDSGDIKELCDVIEVVYALANANGVTIDELHEQRKRKVETNGAFAERIYLERVVKNSE